VQVSIFEHSSGVISLSAYRTASKVPGNGLGLLSMFCAGADAGASWTPARLVCSHTVPPCGGVEQVDIDEVGHDLWPSSAGFSNIYTILQL